jgi:hypothetical protein
VGLRQRFDAHQAGGRCDTLLCDKIPPISPASDPEGDYDYASGGEEEPEKYIINEVLHSMISQAKQAPDVRLVSSDASDEEE